MRRTTARPNSTCTMSRWPRCTIATDRKSVDIVLASTEVPKVHPRQTARVYHAKLAAQTLFDANAPGQMNAYYTLYAFPVK